ncbi:14091_t:CDS:1, partial [Cetraspora pellucida]
WIISEIYFTNRNEYYKKFDYSCLKILIPKTNYEYLIETYVYHYFDPSNYIHNLNIEKSYLIYNYDIFTLRLIGENELFKYNEVNGKNIYMLSEEFVKTQNNYGNLEEIEE